uniref:Uncharacterized protein n=1 Tax=Anguilla anguilla TaxID=7936 RepID=A0A0E9VRR3_ANGAN
MSPHRKATELAPGYV